MAKEKKIEEKYVVLDHIEHILLRPQTYIGANKPHTQRRWIPQGNKMIQEELTYVPSFLKIFDEIISNSVDESKRNKKLTRIDVDIDKKTGEISVSDNGGIPVVIHKTHNQWVPEVIFGNLMSGSNYDDSEERVVMGLNGLGSKLTNVFSKKFVVQTCDGKNGFLQVFSENMRVRTQATITKGGTPGTRISYLPDLERFGLKKLDPSHYKLLHKRVVDIAGCNPSVKIYFCGQEIRCKSFEDYVKWYCQDYYYEKSSDGMWSVAVSPSVEGFSQISFVNGSDTYDGGSHVDYISSAIIGPLREYFLKKYKVDVKPSEIKNHFQIFISSTVINPSFSSQTKEKLITEPKDWGYSFQVSQKMINWILKSEIVKSLTDWIVQKKAADQNKLQRQLNKQVDNLKVEKLVDAKAKDRWRCSLGIFEGDSASNSFRKYRDPQTQGSFSLKGKFINVSDIAVQKMTENKELVNLMSAIGLKLGQKATLKTLRWGRIIFYADQDPDGNSIVALLLNFFYKFWPELFDMNFVYKAETPLMVVKSSKMSEDLWFYSMDEFYSWSSDKNLKDFSITYKKGLGALEDDEYKKIIKTPNLVKISSDELSSKKLGVWFGKNSDLRKEELFGLV